MATGNNNQIKINEISRFEKVSAIARSWKR